MTEPPDVITRYLRAADRKDAAELAACFTTDGTVLDEGVTYTGRDEIVGWREKTISQWEYTSTVGSSSALAPNLYRIGVHLVGNFPGGEVDLAFDFALRDELISSLRIVPTQ
jgi:hypothetical protein